MLSGYYFSRVEEIIPEDKMNLKNNRITNLLGIEYPIIEGGMAWLGTSGLAAAVSNAGALGVIGSGSMTPEILRSEIRKIRTLTQKPFGVNLMLLNPYIDGLVEVVIEENVPAVIFGAGNPGKYLKMVKEKNIKTLAVVASEKLALRLEQNGIDAIIGEGMEAGGHIGTVTTMVLIPKIVETVQIPVIAAGGIVSGKSMLSALILGAEAVQVGTRFIATYECEAHQKYKDLVIKSGIRDAVVTGAKLGHPARAIKTKFTREIGKLETDSPEKAEDLLVGSLRKAFENGDEDGGSFMAGQCVGLIDKITSVKDVVDELIADCETVLRNMTSCLI